MLPQASSDMEKFLPLEGLPEYPDLSLGGAYSHPLAASLLSPAECLGLLLGNAFTPPMGARLGGDGL
jgi:hypothetical protein